MEYYNSIEKFYEYFPAIIYGLEEIITWKDNVTSNIANQLLLTVQAFEFNVSLTILTYNFQYSFTL